MRILRVVGSAELLCGCFVGRYETYSGQTVQIVEEKAVACVDPRHQLGARLLDPHEDHALIAAADRPAAPLDSDLR